jgi:hypothetical protein
VLCNHVYVPEVLLETLLDPHAGGPDAGMNEVDDFGGGENHVGTRELAARLLLLQPMRRGLINGPGTIPALSEACRVSPPPSHRPSAPTPNVILEQVRSLGATRRKASSNETFGPAGFSGTSVNIANGTSVHRPSPSTTGSAEATSSRSSSTAWFRVPDFVRSLEKQVPLTPQ